MVENTKILDLARKGKKNIQKALTAIYNFAILSKLFL
jgi:hypothetical protein